MMVEMMAGPPKAPISKADLPGNDFKHAKRQKITWGPFKLSAANVSHCDFQSAQD